MSRAPAFLAAVAFAAGVWLGVAEWRPPVWWMIAVLVCAGAASLWFAIPSKNRQGGAPSFGIALLALIALGALAIGARDQRRALDGRERTLGPYVSGDDVQVTGHLVRDSTSRARGLSRSEIVDLETECVSAISYPEQPVTVVTIAPEPLAFSDAGP